MYILKFSESSSKKFGNPPKSAQNPIGGTPVTPLKENNFLLFFFISRRANAREQDMNNCIAINRERSSQEIVQKVRPYYHCAYIQQGQYPVHNGKEKNGRRLSTGQNPVQNSNDSRQYPSWFFNDWIISLSSFIVRAFCCRCVRLINVPIFLIFWPRFSHRVCLKPSRAMFEIGPKAATRLAKIIKKVVNFMLFVQIIKISHDGSQSQLYLFDIMKHRTCEIELVIFSAVLVLHFVVIDIKLLFKSCFTWRHK